MWQYTKMPGVPDKAEVNAKSPVLSAAFQAHEDAIGHRRPLGVLRIAIHACLQRSGGICSASQGERSPDEITSIHCMLEH